MSDRAKRTGPALEAHRKFRVANIDMHDDLDGVREALIAFVAAKPG